jgi:outer membrane protein TolC
MPLHRNGAGGARGLLICAALLAGCASPASQVRLVRRDEVPKAAPHIAGPASDAIPQDSPGRARAGSREIVPVNDEELDDAPAAPEAGGDELFGSRQELSLRALVDEVRRRNPTLKAAVAAWQAAAQRCPQVVALDDPVLQSMFAPGSFPSNSSVQASYFVGIAQKVPWPGKRALRGQVAQAESNAVGLDSQDVDLRLAEAARLAFFDYYLARRDLELNAANADAVDRFRATATAKFEASKVAQQDILQAEVELGTLKSRYLELKQNEKIAVGRINTLLHRQPQIPLPPPPQTLDVPDQLPDAAALREQALQRRPDLAAQAARIESEQAAVELALKEFYPDFEFMGRYDQFWTPVEQRPQVGMYFNIPLNQSRRKAAVTEAMFRLHKLQAEYDAQVDGIRNEVQAAHARLERSLETVQLYVNTILPAAQLNVEAASAGYEAGNLDFLRLVEAERQFIELQEKHQEAVAEYHRNRAELDRVVGAEL